MNHELASIDDALKELTVWHAHQALRVAVDKFAASLQSAVRGVPSAAATALGQKLAEEQAASGARFSAHDSLVGPVQNSDRHLFGGSQYYRVLNEFRAAVQSLPIEPVSAEDLTNAMGLAVNGQCESASVATIMLQRCVAAVHPLVVHLFRRLQYVVERMLEYVEATWASSSEPSSTPALEKVLGDELWPALADGFHEHLDVIAQRCSEICFEHLRDAGRASLLDRPSSADRTQGVGDAPDACSRWTNYGVENQT